MNNNGSVVWSMWLTQKYSKNNLTEQNFVPDIFISVEFFSVETLS